MHLFNFLPTSKQDGLAMCVTRNNLSAKLSVKNYTRACSLKMLLELSNSSIS